MSYVLKIRTRDTKLPNRFARSMPTYSDALLAGVKSSPTEFEIVIEDRDTAIATYESAKKNRKPGDEIDLTFHEVLGSL